MANYEIRPAQASEAAQIKALIREVGINPMGLDWRRFLVAVNSLGQVVACGQIKPHGQDIRELASIAVLPSLRGKGLARQIIESLLAQTLRPVYLMCVAHNGPMYEKFGFHALSFTDMPRYFQRVKQVFDLARAVHKTEEDLWVMKLE